MKSIRPTAMIAAILLLSACGRGDDAPGSVSPSEAQALNDAAAMLDANSVDATALGTNAVSVDGENESQPQ